MSVYAIACDGTKRCKIGYARDVKSRLKTLAAVSPGKLTVLAVRDGGRDLEQAIQWRLREDRVYREWFVLTERTLAEFWSAQAAEFYARQEMPVHPVFRYRMERGISLSQCARLLNTDHGRLRGVEMWAAPREPLLSAICKLTRCAPEELRIPAALGGPRGPLAEPVIPSSSCAVAGQEGTTDGVSEIANVGAEIANAHR